MMTWGNLIPIKQPTEKENSQRHEEITRGRENEQQVD